MDTVELCTNEISYHVGETGKLIDCVKVLLDTLQGALMDPMGTTMTGVGALLERAQDHLHEVRKTVEQVRKTQAGQTRGI